MYEEHEDFETPEDNKIIWRYMDFTKFIDILNREKLYFPRVDKLGDPFEGSLPIESIKRRNSTVEQIYPPEFFRYIVSQKEVPKALSKATKSLRRSYAISCWNMSEEESAALWQLYCSGQGGLSIRTTVRRLKKSFEREKRDIFIGKVQYINYLKDSIPMDNALYPFLYKRRSFMHEHELRAFVYSGELI